MSRNACHFYIPDRKRDGTFVYTQVVHSHKYWSVIILPGMLSMRYFSGVSTKMSHCFSIFFQLSTFRSSKMTVSLWSLKWIATYSVPANYGKENFGTKCLAWSYNNEVVCAAFIHKFSAWVWEVETRLVGVTVNELIRQVRWCVSSSKYPPHCKIISN